MKQIVLTTGEWLLVNRGYFKIVTISNGKLRILYNYGDYIGEDAYEEESEEIDLPPGQWSIIGTASELSELECRKIAGSYFGDRIIMGQYVEGSGAKKYLLSLVESEGFKAEETIILKKEA